MKKILAILVLVLFGTMSYAQWSPGGVGVNMWNLNGANVGISNTGVGAFAPLELLHVRNLTGSANVLLDRPYAVPGANAAIGSFRLKNATEGSYFNFSFRYQNGVHEVIQSAFDNSVVPAVFKAFSYFNFVTGVYEIRDGVSQVNFKNTGAVAIGMGTTAVPSGSKLAVGGKIICKEVEVTLTAMPDFVFNPDYKLRSLYDVENFITTNKHLPDVPSETEVIANGLNLGDMNAVLLQKVEELTLYMIKLQKENDALKARVSNLEK